MTSHFSQILIVFFWCWWCCQYQLQHLMLMSQLGLFTNSFVFCHYCLFQCIKLMFLSDVVLIIMMILSSKSSCELIVDCIPFHQEDSFFIIHHSDLWCQMLTHRGENIWCSELSAFYLDSSGFWFSTMRNTRTVFIYHALWYCVILIILCNNVTTSPNFMHHAFWFLLCIADVEPKLPITHYENVQQLKYFVVDLINTIKLTNIIASYTWKKFRSWLF